MATLSRRIPVSFAGKDIFPCSKNGYSYGYIYNPDHDTSEYEGVHNIEKSEESTNYFNHLKEFITMVENQKVQQENEKTNKRTLSKNTNQQCETIIFNIKGIKTSSNSQKKNINVLKSTKRIRRRQHSNKEIKNAQFPKSPDSGIPTPTTENSSERNISPILVTEKLAQNILAISETFERTQKARSQVKQPSPPQSKNPSKEIIQKNMQSSTIMDNRNDDAMVIDTTATIEPGDNNHPPIVREDKIKKGETWCRKNAIMIEEIMNIRAAYSYGQAIVDFKAHIKKITDHIYAKRGIICRIVYESAIEHVVLDSNIMLIVLGTSQKLEKSDESLLVNQYTYVSIIDRDNVEEFTDEQREHSEGMGYSMVDMKYAYQFEIDFVKIRYLRQPDCLMDNLTKKNTLDAYIQKRSTSRLIEEGTIKKIRPNTTTTIPIGGITNKIQLQITDFIKKPAPTTPAPIWHESPEPTSEPVTKLEPEEILEKNERLFQSTKLPKDIKKTLRNLFNSFVLGAKNLNVLFISCGIQGGLPLAFVDDSLFPLGEGENLDVTFEPNSETEKCAKNFEKSRQELSTHCIEYCTFIATGCNIEPKPLEEYDATARSEMITVYHLDQMFRSGWLLSKYNAIIRGLKKNNKPIPNDRIYNRNAQYILAHIKKITKISGGPNFVSIISEKYQKIHNEKMKCPISDTEINPDDTKNQYIVYQIWLDEENESLKLTNSRTRAFENIKRMSIEGEEPPSRLIVINHEHYDYIRSLGQINTVFLAARNKIIRFLTQVKKEIEDEEKFKQSKSLNSSNSNSIAFSEFFASTTRGYGRYIESFEEIHRFLRKGLLKGLFELGKTNFNPSLLVEPKLK